MNELKTRGVEDVLIAIVDGLKGFPEAITAVFPQALVQTCVVHLIRHSPAFVSYKDRKAVALKQIYKAKDADAGLAELEDFADGPWGKKYPAISQSCRQNWSEIIPFFAFPDDVRRIIYTTNAIESLNSKLRRTVRTRGHFPTDESALKLLFLVLNLAAKEWKMPPREWCMANSPSCLKTALSWHDETGPSTEIPTLSPRPRLRPTAPLIWAHEGRSATEVRRFHLATVFWLTP
jgi:putative transposase